MRRSDNLITYEVLVEAKAIKESKEAKEAKAAKKGRKKEEKPAVPKKPQVRRGRAVETLSPEVLEKIDMSGVYQTGFEVVSREENRVSVKPSASSLFVHDGLKSVLAKMK